MKEYKYNNVTVRVHGKIDQKRLEEACKNFVRNLPEKQREELFKRGGQK